MKWSIFLLPCLRLLPTLLLAVPAAAATTEDVFKSIRPAIVIVEIQDKQTGSKSALGSGFFVNSQGRLATNFHVVSNLIDEPQRYSLHIRRGDGSDIDAHVVNVDVVHDLALLDSGLSHTPLLQLAGTAPAAGERLYALGNPLDLGFTIVEGNYNGLIQHALINQIHFSGSINPGMSGGPAVNGDNAVVGINVASAGNGVGFIVPVLYLRNLLQQAALPAKFASTAVYALMGEQILQHQREVTANILKSPVTPLSFGRYLVPGQTGSYLPCWGHSSAAKDEHIKQAATQCGAEGSIFLTENINTGNVQYGHQWLDGGDMSSAHFNIYYQAAFPGERLDDVDGEDNWLTPYRCSTAFLLQHGVHLKTVLCMRRYKRMPALFDTVLYSATLNEGQRGVISQWRFDGFSRDSAKLLLRHYLGVYAWR